MEKKTTRELVGDFIDLECQLEYADNQDEINVIESALTVTKQDISRKVDGIDHFMVNIDKKIHLVDAEVEALNKEIQRLKVRRRATESLKKYFNETLIPMVVEEVGTDGVYETDTARYKLYETYGPVAVLREDDVPDDYKVVKMTTHIDKKKARKELTQGVDIPGFLIQKVKRVRRS
jgi:hypothetical protein